MFTWFGSAGVAELPPMFVSEVVEVRPQRRPKCAGTSGLSGPAAAASVIVSRIAPVDQLEGVDRLRARAACARDDRIAASGVRPAIYRALDDAAEVMILQEIATERQAEQWIRHPDAAAGFMAEAGVGAYPPLFVGRLVQTLEVPGT
jgi:hypothetical protein